MGTPSIEDGISLAQAVLAKRDSRRVEVAQATAAIADEVSKQATVDIDTSNVNQLLADFQASVAGYKLGDDIQPIIDKSTALFAANGVRIVDVSSLTGAIGVMTQQQSEADAANADEDTEIAALKDWATAYTKEPQDPTT